MSPSPIAVVIPPPSWHPPAADTPLRKAAESFEAAFLAEMLKAAGLGRPPESFGGGVGEGQMASFLRRAQAEAMVEAGGIGLAEQVFATLAARADAG